MVQKTKAPRHSMAGTILAYCGTKQGNVNPKMFHQTMGNSRIFGEDTRKGMINMHSDTGIVYSFLIYKDNLRCSSQMLIEVQ